MTGVAKLCRYAAFLNLQLVYQLLDCSWFDTGQLSGYRSCWIALSGRHRNKKLSQFRWKSGSVEQRDRALFTRRNHSLTFRLIIMGRWLSRQDSRLVSSLLFFSHSATGFLIPPLQNYISFLLFYLCPYLQSTVSESLPSTWLCDGVCIGWQSCCFVSRVVWWLSVCQMKRESHRCRLHRHWATPSYWSFSPSKMISSNWPL